MVFHSRLVNTIETYREQIILFFSNVQDNIADQWKATDRCAAYGFVQFLESFQNVFLLNTFSQTDVIYNVLQSENVNIMTCLNVIQGFEKQLDNNRKGFTHCNNCKQKLERGEIRVETNCGNCEKDGFSPDWEKTISMVGQPPFSRKRALDQVDKALTP